MKCRGLMVGLALAVGWLNAGCVERRFVVTSEPPGAKLLGNGQDLGPTPADDAFVYYGNYHFTLIKEGYETLQVDQSVNPPWYQYPAIDFFSENIIPWKIRDVRRLHYQLQPIQTPNIKTVIDRAQEIQSKGKALQPLPEK